MPSNKRIVPNVVVSNVLVDAVVLLEGADGQFSVHGGGWVVLPGVSTSPAAAEKDRAQIRHRADNERFMGILHEL
jgi:hypothetical protein